MTLSYIYISHCLYRTMFSKELLEFLGGGVKSRHVRRTITERIFEALNRVRRW